MAALVVEHLHFRSLGPLPLLTADLGHPLLLGVLLALDFGLELLDENPPGEEPVEGLGAFALALDLEPRREMLEVDARRHGIDVPASLPPRPDELFDQVPVPDSKPLHPNQEVGFFFRPDGKQAHRRIMIDGPERKQ